MQEARSETQTRRNALPVTHTMSSTLKGRFVRGVHLHVREQREVVSLVETSEMRLEE